MTDLEAAIVWYEQLFGRSPDIVPNENEVMWQVTESGWLYVIRDAERAGETIVTISVADLQQLVAELSARGVDAGLVEPVGQAGWKATIVDNDGNTVILIEVSSAS